MNVFIQASVGFANLNYVSCFFTFGSVMKLVLIYDIQIFVVTKIFGGVAERLKASVLKTDVPSGTVGSNPTPSVAPCRGVTEGKFHTIPIEKASYTFHAPLFPNPLSE